MVSEFKIVFQERAAEELNELYTYIKDELRSETAAINTARKIRESILNLKLFPYSCNFIRSARLKEKGYRKLIVNNYIVFYIVDEDNKRVNIMAIIYAGREYDNIL